MHPPPERRSQVAQTIEPHARIQRDVRSNGARAPAAQTPSLPGARRGRPRSRRGSPWAPRCRACLWVAGRANERAGGSSRQKAQPVMQHLPACSGLHSPGSLQRRAAQLPSARTRLQRDVAHLPAHLDAVLGAACVNAKKEGKHKKQCKPGVQHHPRRQTGRSARLSLGTAAGALTVAARLAARCQVDVDDSLHELAAAGGGGQQGERSRGGRGCGVEGCAAAAAH